MEYIEAVHILHSHPDTNDRKVHETSGAKLDIEKPIKKAVATTTVVDPKVILEKPSDVSPPLADDVEHAQFRVCCR